MMKIRVEKMFLLLAAALCTVAPCALADKAAAAAAGVDLDIAYCESTGEQYIDTGILGNPGLRVEAEIMWMETNLVSGADQHILGSYDKINGNTPWRCYPITMSGLRYPFFHYGDKQNDLTAFHYVVGQRYRVVSDLGASEQSFSADGLDGSAAYTATPRQNYTSVSSGKTLYLFALGHGAREDGVNCMTKARVYWLKIYQNDDLVRDYRPACSNGVYGLWEDVNNVFCGSATATPFKDNVPRFARGKPDYFTQWIQSDGTASTYIDTGLYGRPETKIEAHFQWKAVQDRRLICANKNSQYFHIASGANGEMYFRSGSSTLIIDGTAYAANTDYTVVSDVHANSQTYSVTGPFGTITTNDNQTAVNTTPHAMFIFGENFGSGSGGYSKVRLYSMRIWQDGVLVRDFVPGIKGGQGVLYDRENDVCYFSRNGGITSAAGLVGPPAGTPTYPKYKLSYLGSDGGSYMDTGVLGNPGLRVVGDVVWNGLGNNQGDDRHILGSFDNTSYGSGVSRRCYALSIYSNGKANMSIGSTMQYPSFTYTVGQRYLVETSLGATAQSLKVDGASKFTGSASFSEVSYGQTLYLFALGHSSNGAAAKTKARVYSLKIYQNGTLLHDYMPVIADNGGPYFYDKATRTFCQGDQGGFWDVGEIEGRVSLGTSIIFR
jgi:hypothetical protein